MCFSATASFVASGGLAVVAGATLKVAPRRKRFLALIPFFFAVQQFLEGIQWLWVRQDRVHFIAGYGYLVFALVLWPIFIPAAVYRLDRAGRHISRWFLFLGVVVTLWLGVSLSGPLQVAIADGNITYAAGVPMVDLVTVLYAIAVCGALLTSRISAIRAFGILITASAAVAFLWFRPGFPSVWCFFAAVISGLVFFYARTKKEMRGRKN